jgi:hypothetical protein
LNAIGKTKEMVVKGESLGFVIAGEMLENEARFVKSEREETLAAVNEEEKQKKEEKGVKDGKGETLGVVRLGEKTME